jgi:hypothetical protein
VDGAGVDGALGHDGVSAGAGVADGRGRAAEAGGTVVEDGAIERGGCKFQTGASEIDATLETRWRRVVASLGRDDGWLDLNL